VDNFFILLTYLFYLTTTDQTHAWCPKLYQSNTNQRTWRSNADGTSVRGRAWYFN